MYSYLANQFQRSSEQLNVLSVFKPMYIALSMFGLMPYSLKFPKNMEGAVIIQKSIYFNSLCAVSVILIIYLCFVLHVQQLFSVTETNTMTEVLSTKTNYMIELLTFLIHSTIAYISVFKNRCTYGKILNAIVSTNNKLLDRGKGASLRDIQIQVKVITVALCLLMVAQLTINFTRLDTVWKIVLVTLTFILPQIIQFVMISFFYILVMMIAEILKAIHWQLGSIVKARRFNATKFMKMEMQNVELRQIEIIYVKTMETKRDINDAFQACILATAIQSFHSLISETFIIYRGLTGNGYLTTHDVFNCSIWVGYQLLKIYTISRTGVMLKEQLAKIGRSLHGIPTGKEDARLYLEIQHFSTLLKYQNAELTVYDYFPLDATLTFNIVTSAVLYLIILVQFDNP
uniref:Gustatory receptor n=1 Tax=Lobesia botrana TaxID=209534 RepID=A0A345BF03_9NEOP|nr:gustatory receptor GR68.1 [Lobesia botrana]